MSNSKTDSNLGKTAPQIGIVTPDTQTLAAVMTALNLAGKEEAAPAIPQGVLGGCVACGHTVSSHFVSGRWVGCLEGTAERVYILVPADALVSTGTRKSAKQAGGAASGLPASTAHDTGAAAISEPVIAPTLTRGAVRFRYVSGLHHKVNLARAIAERELTPTRARVLKVVHKTGREGLLAKQIIARTKLPHGAVQSTLAWLRAHELVKAEAAPEE